MIEYRVNLNVNNETLNSLFFDAWSNHAWKDFSTILSKNLGHVCAIEGNALIGFVNIAWDGGSHAFLLNPTIRSGYQRKGIGTRLVCQAIEYAKTKSVEWLHVDYEPHLDTFYAKCGFRKTEAGLINLMSTEPVIKQGQAV